MYAKISLSLEQVISVSQIHTELKLLVPGGDIIIAGSFAVGVFLGKQTETFANDIDWLLNKEISIGRLSYSIHPRHPKYCSKFAVNIQHQQLDLKVQIIPTQFHDEEELLSTFDLTSSAISMTLAGDSWYFTVHQDFLGYHLGLPLNFKINQENKLLTLYRACKYADKFQKPPEELFSNYDTVLIEYMRSNYISEPTLKFKGRVVNAAQNLLDSANNNYEDNELLQKLLGEARQPRNIRWESAATSLGISDILVDTIEF